MKREKKSKKLKTDVVPTIFTFSKLPAKRKSSADHLEHNKKRQFRKFNNVRFLSRGAMRKDAFSDLIEVFSKSAKKIIS